MKRTLLLLPIVAIVGGCTPKDRDDAIDQGAVITKRVANSAVAAASDAWRAASEEAAKLTPDSGAAALHRAENALEDVKDKLQPGKRLEEAKAEIARLRAAIDIEGLRAEMKLQVDRAEKLKENAGKTADEVRAKLAAADQAYQDLNEKLKAAQESYDAAKRRVEHAAQSLGG